MRYFVLVDLCDQAPFLPAEIRTWPPEHFLSWLALFGEVAAAAPRPGDPADLQFYVFRAPSGRETGFALSTDGRFYVLSPRLSQVWGEPKWVYTP
jgi:hypothetical protein